MNTSVFVHHSGISLCLTYQIQVFQVMFLPPSGPCLSPISSVWHCLGLNRHRSDILCSLFNVLITDIGLHSSYCRNMCMLEGRGGGLYSALYLILTPYTKVISK